MQLTEISLYPKKKLIAGRALGLEMARKPRSVPHLQSFGKLESKKILILILKNIDRSLKSKICANSDQIQVHSKNWILNPHYFIIKLFI